MKHQIRHHNIYASQPEEILQLIRDACDEMTPQNWENYANRVEKVENEYWIRDHIVHLEIEPSIISFDADSDDEFFYDDCVVDTED